MLEVHWIGISTADADFIKQISQTIVNDSRFCNLDHSSCKITITKQTCGCMKMMHSKITKKQLKKENNCFRDVVK